MKSNETNQATVNEKNNMFSGKTSDLDISSLLKASKETTKSKTNLQKMKEAKENGSLGLVVDKEEIKANSDKKKTLLNKTEAEAIKEIDAYLEETDQLINTAKSIKITEKPKTATEMVALMDILEQASQGQIDLKTEKVDMIQAKTEEEMNQEESQSEPVTSEKDKPEDKRSQIVNILIDKTGLGGEFNFTEEEREKIVSANEIRLKEVEEVDLSTIKVRKSEKSFLESVEEYKLSSSKVPVVFPTSRFKANMLGLSFGELADISLDPENITFEKMRKKLTVIYNKMINVSIGKFKNFEDFLRKFSSQDIDLAVYGLVVATFPEVDEIVLDCHNEKCRSSFYHKFVPRSLIKFDKAGDKFLEAFKEVIDCPAAEAEKLALTSPTRTHKRLRLPHSGFIIEIGIASCYDYLYNMVDNLLGDKFKQNHPEDVNGVLNLQTVLLSLIRAVYVPDGDEYIVYDDFEDVINALYMIKPDEILILGSLLEKYRESYQIVFELTDITCPKCGTVTKSIRLEASDLVFHKSRHLMSTGIVIDNISVL